MNDSADREERFRRAYVAAYDDVLRFVQRRIAPGQAEDVVAEAMLVAWRRVEELPTDPGDARAWLFGIARNCLLNDTRTHRRRDALGVRLAQQVAGGDLTPDDAVADRVAGRLDLAAAWAQLSPADQEVIALSVFEDLTSAQAGAVLGVSAAATRLRLSRARSALRRRLEGAAPRPGPAAASYEEMHS